MLVTVVVTMSSMIVTMPSMPNIMEKHKSNQIHNQTSHRSCHQLIVAHFWRIAEPLNALHCHTESYEHKENSIHISRKNFHSLVAKTISFVRWPLSHEWCNQSYHQCRTIEKHMACVTYQSQTVIPNACNELSCPNLPTINSTNMNATLIERYRKIFRDDLEVKTNRKNYIKPSRNNDTKKRRAALGCLLTLLRRNAQEWKTDRYDHRTDQNGFVQLQMSEDPIYDSRLPLQIF